MCSMYSINFYHIQTIQIVKIGLADSQTQQYNKTSFYWTQIKKKKTKETTIGRKQIKKLDA